MEMLLSLHHLVPITVSLVSNETKPANNLFILSIRAIAKSILGPVTIHICEPDNALFLRKAGHKPKHKFRNA
jgi:hypothetical protein